MNLNEFYSLLQESLKDKPDQLFEMAYTIAIINLPAHTKVLDRSRQQIDLIVREFVRTKYECDPESLRKYIENELVVLRKCKAVYDALIDDEKTLFWTHVDALDNILKVEEQSEQ